MADLNKPKFGKVVFGSLFNVGAAAIGFAAGQPLLASLQLGNAIYNASKAMIINLSWIVIFLI